jgi:ubiquinone/menaquinone biosynthesis C-methylase UbiE
LNTYEGLHAAHYDLVYAQKPYDREAAFVADQLAQEIGAGPWKLMDVACGTGRHALEFAELGHEVTGVDYSPDLLELAHRNAGDRVRLLEQDMRELEVDGGPFDAVTCLFDSIGYPLTNEGIVAALVSMRSHLKPDGALAVEFLHAPAMLAGATPTRVRRWDTPDGDRLVRISETSLDPVAQVMRVSYEVFLLGDDTYRTSTETQSNRFFGIEEMRALMEAAGLRVARFVPAYEPGAEVTGDTWHIMAVARPAV